MLVRLPPPSENQPFFRLTPLDAGQVQASEEMFVSDPEKGHKRQLPALSFLLQHSDSKTNILFDLGIKKDVSQYAPATRAMIDRFFRPCGADPDVVRSLQESEAKLAPTDITHVILSHVHWDHVGDHEPFYKAKFILGGPGKPLIQNGYPDNPYSPYLRTTVPEDRATWFDYDGWKPIGPFERGYDLFGDGSLYLIDAAGHVSGHINALVRTNSNGGWDYLGGDSAHDTRLLTGDKHIGHFIGLDGNPTCMHQDEEMAKDHIRRITQLPPDIKIWLAHDPRWKEKLGHN